MRLRLGRKAFIGIFCLYFSSPVLSDYPIEVIELKSRPLDELLPVIQPFAGDDGTVTGMGNKLIIKASPARVKEIRQLLVTLDRPPRRLLISIGKQAEEVKSSSGYRANADIKAGDSRFSINSPGYPVDSSRAHIRIHESTRQDVRASRHRVQALEGRPAYINSGSRIPLQTTSRYHNQGAPYPRHGTQLQDVTSGFYVVPRLNGDEVSLEIMQHDDRASQRGDVINTQNTATVVRGRLGEWVELGGVNESGNSQQSGLGRSLGTQVSDVQGIQVKVECLDCGTQDRQLQDLEWK